MPWEVFVIKTVMLSGAQWSVTQEVNCGVVGFQI